MGRADGFHGEEYRIDFIATHAALRFVLGKAFGLEPALVRFAQDSGSASGAGGGGSRTKPAVLTPERVSSGLINGLLSGEQDLQPDLRFNLSHTRGAAMIAIAIGRETGIDIEWQRPMDDLDSMARAVMCDAELEVWQLLAPDDRLHGFYHLWTRKEAYLKAIGLGLFRDPQQVEVPVSANRLAFHSREVYDAVRVRDSSGEGVWKVADLPCWEGYSASVCFEGLFDGSDQPRIQIIDLDWLELGA